MAESFNDIIKSGQPVLVDFYADWCGPCRAMEPVIQQVAKELEGKARILKVNIDKTPSASSHFNVNAVPTFMLFKNGIQVWRHSGMLDRQTLINTILAKT